MNQWKNISDELNELNSELGKIQPAEPYRVPEGYFSQLPGKIMNAIRSLEKNEKEVDRELASLSPLLGAIPKQPSFSVPQGYFDNLEKNLKDIVKQVDKKAPSSAEEIIELSPLLANLKNKPTYTVPQGFFEKLEIKAVRQAKQPAAKIIPIGRKWIRYAAAAVIIGFVATAALIFINNKERIDPAEKSYAWVKKNMKKVSTDDISEFVELASAGSPDAAPRQGSREEISELMKDVSDKEIQEFLNDTPPAEPESGDDLILN